MRKPADDLCKKLSYTFRHSEYLDIALTHRSAGKLNNERLEFLGDSILSLVITEYLYAHYLKASEGELSRLRSSLVKGDKLAEIAKRIELGDYLFLGTGELRSGGFRRSSILADALEAIFGAIFLDSDFDTGKKVILGLYQQELDGLPDTAASKDNKTRLQEYMQSRQLPLPVYNVTRVSGEPHQQEFTVECQVEGVDQAVIAKGGSRRKAEQAAAAVVLEIFNQ